jgi:hypothetical protein
MHWHYWKGDVTATVPRQGAPKPRLCGVDSILRRCKTITAPTDATIDSIPQRKFSWNRTSHRRHGEPENDQRTREGQTKQMFLQRRCGNNQDLTWYAVAPSNWPGIIKSSTKSHSQHWLLIRTNYATRVHKPLENTVILAKPYEIQTNYDPYQNWNSRIRWNRCCEACLHKMNTTESPWFWHRINRTDAKIIDLKMHVWQKSSLPLWNNCSNLAKLAKIDETCYDSNVHVWGRFNPVTDMKRTTAQDQLRKYHAVRSELP